MKSVLQIVSENYAIASPNQHLKIEKVRNKSTMSKFLLKVKVIKKF
jgi:hypothetical protein